MIFIVVKFPVKPEYSDSWIDIVSDFTKSTRAEDGNVFFDWSRSVDDRNEYLLVEGFRDGDAGGAHVSSDHFKTAVATLGAYISAAPKIINVQDASDWGPMAEIQPR